MAVVEHTNVKSKYKSLTVKRILLATNILTITALTIVLFKEKYPSRVYHKFFSQPQWNYANNISYENYTTIYPLYNEQKNIIMLGNSLTAYANWNELLNRFDVATRGIGGDITAGFVARLDNIINLKPKIVFIEGGINDLNSEISQDDIINNLTIIIDTLQANNIKPVLTTVTLLAEHFNSRSSVEQNKKIKELNKQIIKLANEKNISFIDLNRYVSNENFCNPEFVVKDGIHFSGKTYMVWKQEVEKILKQENLYTN